MPYTPQLDLDPRYQAEFDLLASGLSYTEVAAITGTRIKTIGERNRFLYKVDIWEAFKRRVERDGMPNRLTASDPFCSWFTGFFDGEGTLTVFTRPSTGRPQYSEYRLAVAISVRDDDADAILSIQDNLGVGIVYRQENKGRINPTISWRTERIQDLAEVLVPLFDRHPLYTKKAKEYALWRRLVMLRYLATMGGYSNRRRMADEDRLAFHETIKLIGNIRTYARAIPESLPDALVADAACPGGASAAS